MYKMEDIIQCDVKVKNIVNMYILTKDITLKLEEIDATQKANPQFYIGMRNAYDHFMRIVAVKYGIKKVGDEKIYVEENLAACFNHIYRVGFDCLDMSSIILMKKISDELHGFSNDAITQIIPEYYKEIRPYTEDIRRKIAEWRKSKDVGDINNIKDFIEYYDANSKLYEYWWNIIKMKAALIEYDRKKDKDKRKEYIMLVIVSLAGVILGAILTALFF